MLGETNMFITRCQKAIGACGPSGELSSITWVLQKKRLHGHVLEMHRANVALETLAIADAFHCSKRQAALSFSARLETM